MKSSAANGVSPETMPFVAETAKMLGVKEKPGSEKFSEAILKALETTKAKKDVLDKIAKEKFNGNVAALQERLDLVEKNLNYSEKFRSQIEKVENKGILSKIKDGLLAAPKFLWRHKGKILIGAAVAGVIALAALGISGGLSLAGIERFFQQVGVKKVVDGMQAARPLGGVGAGNFPGGANAGPMGID